MRIDIISAVPQLMESPFSHSILKRAKEKGLLEVFLHDLRDYTDSKHKQIDDYQFGGGAGMVLMIEPIERCIQKLKSERDYAETIYMTPDGNTLTQSMCNQLSMKGNLIILCGHYKGVDERVREHFISMEISVGDYVLSGGELAACILVDAIGRLIPGVLNDESSALLDSFQDNLLSAPIYTRPADYKGWKVPEILLSGNEKKINQWRDEESFKRTELRRPDLLDKS
jgi:tRNA (guanine37-N1)-methyltransferase